jgi:two-component system, OmpR family, copper resistance phosphate regulon response regulator CusR
MTKPYAVIIEDDPKLSAIYQTALEHVGFEAALDINGDKYRSLLAAARPDLIILDIHLPYASGIDILKVIRDQYPDVMVVVTTADLVKAKTLTGQADHVLIKPVSVASLLKIAEAVKDDKWRNH